jgi:hypothetical protein
MLTTVNSPLDNLIDNDGLTTLREAIRDTVDGTVTFASSLNNATISLGSLGEISFGKNLTIDGTDANGMSRRITIEAFDPDNFDADPNNDGDNDGDGARIFNITDPFGGTVVTMKGLTLTGGDVEGEGGAIRSTAALNLSQCTIKENSAVPTGGSGGGIFLGLASGATATITDCIFTDNRASDSDQPDLGGGGAIDAVIAQDASLRITDSKISGNAAGNDGGGIRAR